MRLPIMMMAVVLLTLGCKERSQPATQKKEAAPGVWAHYAVWAAEGDSMATCKLQFYDGPKKRQAVRLPPPARVWVDGVPLQADSAGMSGVYYEYRAPLNFFSGPHEIRFTDATGRAFVDRFSFPFFKILDWKAQGQNAYLLNIEGLPQNSQLRVALTDTAFDHEGFNDFLPVANGRLLIDSSILNKLEKGPVQLHVAAEEDRPLRSGLGGSISISYSAGRSFAL